MQAKEYYEQYWSDSGFNPRAVDLPSKLLAVMSANIGSGSSVLDVGCGNGAKIRPWVTEQSIDYLGIDVSVNAVSAAQESGLSARVVDDVIDLPFEANTFDAVVSLEVFEHLLDPLTAATEILRILKPGGVLIASVPNAVEIRRRLEFMCGTWNPVGDDRSIAEPWRDPHIRFFSVHTLRAMIARAGYSNVKVGYHFDEPSASPSLQRRVADSKPYRTLTDRFPSLFATRLHVVAKK